MMLAAAAMALPDAGATSTTLETRHRAALLKRTRPPNSTTPMCARNSLQPTPALNQERTEVALPAHDLSNKKPQISARRQDNNNILRRHSRHSSFILLKQNVKTSYEKGDTDTHINADTLHEKPVSRLPSGQNNPYATARGGGDKGPERTGDSSGGGGGGHSRGSGHESHFVRRLFEI